MRDPVIYRIKRAHHIRCGNEWCIYPMYDYTHCISDATEGITHSCCSLEFEDHRPLYDWIIDHLECFIATKTLLSRPRQIEFARLQLCYTITSKRKLNQLVVDGLVTSWDDPRMPTISGMRRRGYTPDGIKLFAKRCGVAKSPNTVSLEDLEIAIREDLEQISPRVLAVLNPLKVVITNFNEIVDTSKVVPFHPSNPAFGEREVRLTQEIYIEQDDFMLEPIAKWQRLGPNLEIRLRHSYIIKCQEVVLDDNGRPIELRCTADSNTLGKTPEGRKVKGVIHWVSTTLSVPTMVRLYERLFVNENPELGGGDFTRFINHDSLKTITGHIEPAINNAPPESHYQFERLGYFVVDRYDSTAGNLVFNKTVGLRDTWKAKE